MTTVNGNFTNMYINRLKDGTYRLYGKKLVRNELVESSRPGESDLKQIVSKYKIDITVDEMSLSENDYERKQEIIRCIEEASGEKADNLESLVDLTHIADKLMQMVDKRRKLMKQQITTFLEVVDDVDVNFIRVFSNLAWQCEIDGEYYGGRTVLTEKSSDRKLFSTWKTLRHNAKEAIK